MDGLVTLIIWIIIVGLVIMLAIWAIRTLGVPEPFAKIATVLIVVLACLMLFVKAAPMLGVGL